MSTIVFEGSRCTFTNADDTIVIETSSHPGIAATVTVNGILKGGVTR